MEDHLMSDKFDVDAVDDELVDAEVKVPATMESVVHSFEKNHSAAVTNDGELQGLLDQTAKALPMVKSSLQTSDAGSAPKKVQSQSDASATQLGAKGAEDVVMMDETA